MIANALETIRTGKISRGRYAALGIFLFLIKYNIDRLIAASYSVTNFYPWSYIAPSWTLQTDSDFLLTVAFTAVPFATVGVFLSVLRLRSAGWPIWVVILFFPPLLNLIFFAVLCWLPPANRPRAAEPGGLGGWLRWILPHSVSGAAAVAVFLCALGTSALAWMSTSVFQNYGAGLFFGIPFVAGFLSVIIASTRGRLRYGTCVRVSLLTVVVTGVILFLLAIEGAICLLMALPIGLFMAWLGGSVGYAVQESVWKYNQAGSTLCVMLAVMPGVFTVEEKADAPLQSCVTEVHIAAPPETVWNHVVEFSTIPKPTEWVFQTGIAYPIEAVIEGRGVGAIRRCRFSTGDFVEPITAWEHPHRLAFSVESQPEPMQEASIYRHVHPPHMEGFMVSERGEFQLIRTGDGGTILRGTTWYRQRLWPQSYWLPFSDHLIHTIHRRVLEHIRVEVEQSLNRPMSEKSISQPGNAPSTPSPR